MIEIICSTIVVASYLALCWILIHATQWLSQAIKQMERKRAK